MSFFDEDDEPTRTRPRPRRAAPPPRGGGSPDRQNVRQRQAIAIGGALVFLFLLVLVFKGCADSRKKNALKDYNREHTSIVSESDQQVGAPFFDLLGRVGEDSPTDIAANVGSLRVTAEQHLDQAEGLSVPDEMLSAQRSLLIALEFRRDALAAIQEQIVSALADDEEVATAAVEQIAAQMQAFLASDVIHEGRVVPMIKAGLDENEIGGQQIQQSRFLQTLDWLDTDTIAESLNASVSGGGGGGNNDEEVRPGTHGHGLTGTTVGETALTVGEGAVNRIPSERGLTFLVAFENQGENDEFDVEVVVRIKPDEGKAITTKRTLDTTTSGNAAEASISVPTPPPAGTPATVEVEVRPVGGEQKTDNNSAEYTVLFVEP